MKIFLTSDVHLGMKFAGYPDIQDRLVQARFDALQRCVERANKDQCDAFIIAGDLFDRVSIAKKDIQQAAAILGEFEGNLTAVLPGNHDYVTPGQEGLWSSFQNFSDNRILVLDECKIYPLQHFDLDCNLYAAPCFSKHSSTNHIGWIKKEAKDTGVSLHIGVAHGSLEGLSIDFNQDYYPMSERELKACGLDLWLMGHTHILYPEKPEANSTVYYPGTPEPDGFDCKHAGSAVMLEIDDQKQIKTRYIQTGAYLFAHETCDIKKLEDLKPLTKTYLSPEHKNTLLKLKIKGRIKSDEFDGLPELQQKFINQMMYFKLDMSDLSKKIDPAEIDQRVELLDVRQPPVAVPGQRKALAS
jgi:DNA repair exonuclease SbcCD nuclease subunit